MANWDFKFKDNKPGYRLSKITKVTKCVVCGKKLGLFDGKRITHKGECKGIYQNAYKRWQLGKDY